MLQRVYKEVIQHDIVNPTTLPESEMSWKVLILSNTFKMFDRTMLQRVYESVISSCSSEKDLARNILVDTMVMSGTPEAVKFFKHLFESGELRSSQISSIFFALPRTIVTPTSYLLEELFELVKSEPIKRETYVWNTAILSLSGLLQKACVSPVAKENYPTQVYGKFCHKDSGVPDIGFPLDGLTLDELEELLKKVGSGSNNGPWKGKEDRGDLAAPELSTLNKMLEELDGFRGATHHNGVNKDVPGKILLVAAGAHDSLIDPLEHGPVKHLECVG